MGINPDEYIINNRYGKSQNTLKLIKPNKPNLFDICNLINNCI